MFDGLIAFAMDRWCHDTDHITAKPMSEGLFDLGTFRSERTNEASTLTITPKRSSSWDVGTSSYRYHTATTNTTRVHTSTKKTALLTKIIQSNRKRLNSRDVFA
ncbi:hypothetical protein TNCV_5093841 [Trichonephila clavipes]|nr:hypothetical protein TNCV_5093841 [Trichonephila clavipes]